MAKAADRRKIPPAPDKVPPLTAAAATTLVDETISALEEWRRLVLRGPLDLARNTRVAPVKARAVAAVNAVIAAAPRMRDRNGCPLEVRKPIHHGRERKGEVVASCGAHGALALCLVQARVSSDRNEVLPVLESGIKAASELRADVAPQSALAEVQDLRMDEARRVVTYRDREYPFGSARAFDVFCAIARGRGAWVTGGALGPRPDKVRGQIPPELRALIVAKRGAGGGYRLPPDRATVP